MRYLPFLIPPHLQGSPTPSLFSFPPSLGHHVIPFRECLMKTLQERYSQGQVMQLCAHTFRKLHVGGCIWLPVLCMGSGQ